MASEHRLPIVAPPPNESRSTARSRTTWRSVALHAGRVLVLAAIVWLIRDQHLQYQAQQAARDAAEVTLDQLRGFFPTAATVSNWDVRRGTRDVLNAGGQSVGYFVQTSPASDRIVGYSGPTNALLAFGPDDRIVGLQILSSGDTDEHVADVLQDPRFLKSFNALTWEEAAVKTGVDAVSGATLTSLAIVESVQHRLGSDRPSFKFPEEVSLDEARTFFPQAAALVPRADLPRILDCVDSQGKVLGSVVSSSPAADALMGYQGPTDTLLALGPEGRSLGVSIRKSYDNQPYVGYAGGDAAFLSLFEGQSLQELSKLDPKAAEIEGVSGATMTSMAIAYGLPKAAEAALTKPPTREQRLVFSTRDAGTIAVVVLAGLMGFTGLRGRRALRIGFQVLLVVYLGFLNGDILSQALLVGWSQSGPPWRLAPGLVVLTVAALLVPVLSKKNLYCHQICPFGAAQQLVKQRLPWNWSPPTWLTRAFQWIPLALLALVIWTAMSHADINLAAIEPFDAFVFWVAGSATLAIAAVGLVAATFVPMAYCRFGCPTGALLSFLRFSGQADKLGSRDLAAIGLLLLAAALRFL